MVSEDSITIESLKKDIDDAKIQLGGDLFKEDPIFYISSQNLNALYFYAKSLEEERDRCKKALELVQEELQEDQYNFDREYIANLVNAALGYNQEITNELGLEIDNQKIDDA